MQMITSNNITVILLLLLPHGGSPEELQEVPDVPQESG